jgi:AcrR family transcriptional regulator
VRVESKREDRRVRRTRRLLHEALRSLILQKGYDHVTIQDVIDRADVGRATFYAHFRDKDDLLMSGFEEMRKSLRQHLVTSPRAQEEPLGEGLGIARALFDHAQGHRREYRAHVGSRGGDAITTLVHKELTSLVRTHLDQVIAHRRVKPVVPVEVITHYVVSALLALLTWWLDSDLPYTADRMAQMVERLMTPAVAAALS